MGCFKYCSNCVNCVSRLDKNNRKRLYCSISKRIGKEGVEVMKAVSFDGTCYQFEEKIKK